MLTIARPAPPAAAPPTDPDSPVTRFFKMTASAKARGRTTARVRIDDLEALIAVLALHGTTPVRS